MLCAALPLRKRLLLSLNRAPFLAKIISESRINIVGQGTVLMEGYVVRLPLALCTVFTANPEDYTARGKIITPLKDRIGSEIRTHYPQTLEHGVAITQQEAWTERQREARIPRFIREVVEGVAFAARRERRIDKKSGV